MHERHPGVDVQRAGGDAPLRGRAFDAALAQLVVHFMADPFAGLREMARVTREDGVVAACVWDHAGEQGPLGAFWRGGARARARRRRTNRSLRARARAISSSCSRKPGCAISRRRRFPVSVEHPTFEEWWEPFTLGVGPAGAYVVGLDPEQQAELRERCREQLPEAPFMLPREPGWHAVLTGSPEPRNPSPAGWQTARFLRATLTCDICATETVTTRFAIAIDCRTPASILAFVPELGAWLRDFRVAITLTAAASTPALCPSGTSTTTPTAPRSHRDLLSALTQTFPMRNPSPDSACGSERPTFTPSSSDIPAHQAEDARWRYRFRGESRE